MIKEGLYPSAYRMASSRPNNPEVIYMDMTLYPIRDPVPHQDVELITRYLRIMETFQPLCLLDDDIIVASGYSLTDFHSLKNQVGRLREIELNMHLFDYVEIPRLVEIFAWH